LTAKPANPAADSDFARKPPHAMAQPSEESVGTLVEEKTMADKIQRILPGLEFARVPESISHPIHTPVSPAVNC